MDGVYLATVVFFYDFHGLSGIRSTQPTVLKTPKLTPMMVRLETREEIRRNPQKHPINTQKYRFCLGVSCKQKHPYQIPPAKTLPVLGAKRCRKAEN